MLTHVFGLSHVDGSVHVNLPDGRVTSMSLVDAAALDKPEGSVTVTVSATLFQELVTVYKKHSESEERNDGL